ncbi:MAG: TIM barrel protein [bacterium]
MKALLICDGCDLEKVAPICSTEGYGIEMQSFHDPKNLANPDGCQELHLDAIRNIPLRSMHGPLSDLVPGSFDPLVRKLALKRFYQALAVGSTLETSHMIFHHGYVPGTSSPKNWLKRSVAFWSAFLSNSPEKIQIHIENHLDRDPELLSDLVAAIGEPRFDICLDFGHAHCFSRLKPLKWIDRLGGQIGYVHLHNNYGEHDEHLGLDVGSIPMIDVCHALEESAPGAVWALEVDLRFLRKTLEWLKLKSLI